MIQDAILQKLLNMAMTDILWALCITFFSVGVAGSLVVPLFITILENTKRAKALRKKELNAELQRKYEQVCAELRDVRQEYDSIAAENIQMAALLREEQSHNKNWDLRAGHQLAGR